MTMQTSDLTVRKTVTVYAPRDHAFRVWTEYFDAWWPRGHHIGEADLEKAVIEWHEGGRVYEVGVDGTECDWGRVLVYEPPTRIVCSWQIGGDWKFDPDPEHASEYEVRFIEQDESTTLVEFEHRNLERHGPDSAKLAESVGNESGGWGGLLNLFKAEAEASS